MKRICINCKWLSVSQGYCDHPETRKLGERPHDDTCPRFEPVDGGSDKKELEWPFADMDLSGSSVERDDADLDNIVPWPFLVRI
jgi:hypothetical protein